MSLPKKHHYIPVFYLKKWAGPQGVLCEYSRPYKKATYKWRNPHAVGYMESLYTVPGLPPGDAQYIGLVGLSGLLELAFNDDIRNAISHADYVIWDDGLRLRKRNGGYSARVSFEEVGHIITRGVNFFELLKSFNITSVGSFHPPKKIVGRFSANFPMPWTVAFDPENRTFRLSGSSPGPVTTPEYERQERINNHLGGKVLATYNAEQTDNFRSIDTYIHASGFEPNTVGMDAAQLTALARDVDRHGMWDARRTHTERGDVLIASPWGFRWLRSTADFDSMLPLPLLDLHSAEVAADAPKDNT